MNKKMLALSMAMVFSGLVGASQAAQAPISNAIDLAGHVLSSSSCVIDAPTTVAFDDVPLTDIGTIASEKPYKNDPGAVYDINVTKCPANQNVSVTILGTPASEDSNLIALDDLPGSAQHVGISFWDNDIEHGNQHMLMVPNSGDSTTHSTNSAGTLHIPLYVAPAQTAGSDKAIAGTISATTNVKVNFL